MSHESIKQIWQEYQKLNPNTPEEYDAWAFGDSKEMADELAKLVIDGVKTATSSNYLLYEVENEPLPQVGQYDIILDGNGMAVAIVQTTSVEIVPFNEVTDEHAYLEGEGDRSLKYWRDVHQSFFAKEWKEAEQVDQDFHDNILVVCERFKLVYKR